LSAEIKAKQGNTGEMKNWSLGKGLQKLRKVIMYLATVLLWGFACVAHFNCNNAVYHFYYSTLHANLPDYLKSLRKRGQGYDCFHENAVYS
jgi:hypothetical protein